MISLLLALLLSLNPWNLWSELSRVGWPPPTLIPTPECFSLDGWTIGLPEHRSWYHQCVSSEARTSESRSGSVQNEGASAARAFVTSL